MADTSTRLDMLTRPVRDADAAALIALIAAVYAEYDGCVLDLDGVDDDLVAPATSYRRAGGQLWVVDGTNDDVVASIGIGPLRADGAIELKRLYVGASARRRGLGERLVRFIEDQARALGATTVDLWSDTRFSDAHRLYERLGYRDTGARRYLADPSRTTERHFERDV